MSGQSPFAPKTFNLRGLLITARLDQKGALMFQRRGLIALVLFVAGCATASEPPVQQAVVSEPAWVATSQSAVSDLPSVVVEKSTPSLAQQPKRSAVVQPKQVVPDTYPSDEGHS